MPGKRNTTESPWRPSGKWFSTLLPRRSSTRSTSKTQGVSEDQSPDKNGRAIGRLEVDLSTLGGSDLAEGWLEPSAQDTQQGHDKQRRSSTVKATENSSMLGESLFANKSVLGLANFEHKNWPNAQEPDEDGKRPRPLSEIQPESITYRCTSGDLTQAWESQHTGSLLDRGRPVERRYFLSDWPRKTEERKSKVSSQQAPAPIVEPAPSEYPSQKPVQKTGKQPPLATSLQAVHSQIRSPLNGNPAARHSMHAAISATPRPSDSDTRPRLVPRSLSSAPADRIKAWQKTVTSAPVSIPSPGPSTASNPTSSSAVTPSRKFSTRGTASDRLVWIKELEEKRSNGVNRDIGVLQKQSGSVADKLAMFESKQTPAASPALRLSLPTRSNSITSRLSWAGFDSTASTQGNVTTATPRTSIDTVRSSHRTSSVMSYYDDSFREKLESITTNYAVKQDKSDAQANDQATDSVDFKAGETKKHDEVQVDESEGPVEQDKSDSPVKDKPTDSVDYKAEEKKGYDEIQVDESEEPVKQDTGDAQVKDQAMDSVDLKAEETKEHDEVQVNEPEAGPSDTSTSTRNSKDETKPALAEGTALTLVE